MRKADEEINLIELEPNIDPKDMILSNTEISYFGTLTFRVRILLQNLAYFLCQNSIPSLMIFFANKKFKNEDVVVAIGASNMIMNLTLSPFILGLASVIEILGAQSYSAKKYYLFGCYLNRVRMIGYLLFTIIAILMIFFANFFYNLMGYGFYARLVLGEIMAIRIINSYIELEYNIMLRYMQITGNGVVGFFLVFIGFASFPVYCYFLVIQFDLGGYGIGLSYVGLTLTTLIPIWGFILYTKPNEESIFFFDKHSFDGFKQIALISLFLSVIMILDYFNTELMSFFANFYDKTSYVSFIIAISIYYFFNSFYLSYNVLTCVCVSFYVGKNDIESAKKIISYICIDATIIGICLFIFTFPLRFFLVELLSNNSIVVEKAASLLILFNTINLFENYMGILFSALKGLKRIYLNVVLYVFLNLVNVGLLLYFKYYTNIGISSIPISNNIINVVSAAVYGITLYIIDWKELFRVNKEELEEEESKVNDVYLGTKNE